MDDREPKSWLLNGRNGWGPSAPGEAPVEAEHVSADPAAGIRLAGVPGGPLAFDSADGSLGGLVLPTGAAIDGGGRVYLLVKADDGGGPRIKRFDPESGAFAALPAVGGEGSEARRFHSPRNIAIAGPNLYVADTGNRRVQVFDVDGLQLRHVWGPRDANGLPAPPDDPAAWTPYDVATGPRDAYILDRHSGRVYRHRVGSATPRPVVDTQSTDYWERIAVDRDGRIYLLAEDAQSLRIYDAQGRPFPPKAGVSGAPDPGDYRARFDLPPLRLDGKGRFCLPGCLARACDRGAPAVPPSAENPLAWCRPGCDGLLFDLRGCPVKVVRGESPGPPPFETSGTWIGKPLDSRIYRCQWHRIELSLIDLPAGATVKVGTFASDSPRSEKEIRTLPEGSWDTAGTLAGRSQRPPRPGAISAGPPKCDPGLGVSPLEQEFLIQSAEGRYLWLRLDLSGDGYATPAVGDIRIHYPRASYLEHLPAIFSFDAEGRRFLEQFLSAFQTTWDEIDRKVSGIAGLFDPAAVPDQFLEYLAGWLALPTGDPADKDARRRLLQAAPEATPRRGTIGGLRGLIRAHLQAFTQGGPGNPGIAPDDQGPYPVVLEGYRERRRLALSRQGLAELGRAAPTWGADLVGRFQLGQFDRAGRARLVSAGDPPMDVFQEYAHRFRVVVPAAWVRTDEHEQTLRRALDAERPAHTRFELCLAEPRFRIGVQSTVGIDAIVGAPPEARLACGCDGGEGNCGRRAPSRRLGYDTVLACRPGGGGNGGRAPSPGARVGIETILA